MRADEMRTGIRRQRLEFGNHHGFDASDVADDGVALQKRPHLFHERTHLGQRGAEDDKFCVLDGRSHLAFRKIIEADALTFGDGGVPAHVTLQERGEFALANGQSERAAEQANTDQGYFPKQHRGIKSGAWT